MGYVNPLEGIFQLSGKLKLKSELGFFCMENSIQDYLEGLIGYLRGFLLRTQPLVVDSQLSRGPSKWLDSVEFFEAVFFLDRKNIGKQVNMGNYGFERWRFLKTGMVIKLVGVEIST